MLLPMGLLGQNITCDSDRVWMTKTHYPQDVPGSAPFTANKMIVIGRNPIDVIPSLANLVNTQSHSLEINEQYHVDFPEFWANWVTQMTQNIKKNHEDVLELAATIPTYFLRFEDLKTQPKDVLLFMFAFLLDVDINRIYGTVAERRILEVMESGYMNKAAYKLKDTTRNLSRQRHMYSDA